MGSDALSRPASGFMIVAYLAASFTTVVLAIGSLGLCKNTSDVFCESTEICSSFFYTLPAIATPFSIITLVLALVQTRLYYTRAITGVVVCISSTFAAILWLIVVKIGWSQTTVSYDALGRHFSLGFTSWFSWIQDFYNQDKTVLVAWPVLNESQPLDVGFRLDMKGTKTINFSFGLLVMTHIIFILSIIMAVIGLAVHFQQAPDGNSTRNQASSAKFTINKGPWVHPHALADMRAEEPMSSV